MDELSLDLSGDVSLHTGQELSLDTSGLTPNVDEEETTIEITDAEQIALDEVNEVLAGFRSRARNENVRFEQATDSEYWVALCFQTRQQKEEFLTKLGLLELGDKYLDGMAVADKLGITLESPVPPMPNLREDGTLLGLT